MCLALGYRSLAELRDNLPSAEYPLWQAYGALFGFPSERIEWALALAASANVACHGQLVKPKEFIPNFDATDNVIPWDKGGKVLWKGFLKGLKKGTKPVERRGTSSRDKQRSTLSGTERKQIQS